MSKKTALLTTTAAGVALLLGLTTALPANAANSVTVRAADQLGEATASLERAVDATDSEELVRAMYFGQGELARELADKPGFWYLKDVVGANLDRSQRAAIDRIVETMRARGVAEFDNAVNEMTSADPYRVADEMRRMNASFEAAIRSVSDDTALVAFSDDATIASPVVVVAVVFHAGVAVTGVAVGVVAVAVANSVVWHNQVKVTSRADRPGGEERFLAEVTASLAR